MGLGKFIFKWLSFPCIKCWLLLPCVGCVVEPQGRLGGGWVVFLANQQLLQFVVFHLLCRYLLLVSIPQDFDQVITDHLWPLHMKKDKPWLFDAAQAPVSRKGIRRAFSKQSGLHKRFLSVYAYAILINPNTRFCSVKQQITSSTWS